MRLVAEGMTNREVAARLFQGGMALRTRDGVFDVGEDLPGAWPDRVQDRAELVGGGDRLADEVVAGVDHRARGAGLGRERLQAAQSAPSHARQLTRGAKPTMPPRAAP